MMMSWINVGVGFGSPLQISALIVGVASLCGCVSESLSRAFVDPGTGWSSEVAGRAQHIIGPDVDILVKASNSVSSLQDETKNDTFGVSLYFVPKTDGLDFAPAEVSLQIPGLAAIKPKRFDIKLSGYNTGIWNCNRYPPENFGPGPRYTLRQGFCVDLYFDIPPPSPDTEFVLRIPELTQNDRRISIPSLEFRKGTGRIIDFPIR